MSSILLYGGLTALLACLVTFPFWSGLVRYIPNNRIGILEKVFSATGSVKQGFIAMNGESGFQPQILRGGWHLLTPFQYRVHLYPLVTIPQGKIGYIFARDGVQLEPSQALASNQQVNTFHDAAAFLKNGGQKGPQRAILREGTYALNVALFAVITEDRVHFLRLDKGEDAVFHSMLEEIQKREGFAPLVIKGSDDKIGIVTTHDGPSLPPNEIIAPNVGHDEKNVANYHNNFQDADKFLTAGGKRGRQLQVLVEGTYYINRLFATVEMVKKTIIDVGFVGVVNSFTGSTGEDLSGSEYKHGELVKKGYRGVCEEPMGPGKYAFNTYAGSVIMVPTTNIILKWISNQVGSHKFDENLAEVDLITKDAFEPSLPLSVVIHVDYKKAPLVIQRFGDMKKLVEQTLDPLVAAYFKNVAQKKTFIELLQERSSIQEEAGVEMKRRFEAYDLELQEVLIGTPGSKDGKEQNIEQMLSQLRQRQIAAEQIATYQQQEKAAGKERELNEAAAIAEQQAKLTGSSIAIKVQENEGKAALARATQEAETIRALAGAEADKIRIMAEAEADRTARVGMATAMATEAQVAAFGGAQYQLTKEIFTRFAEAIETSKVPVVPHVNISGAAGGNGGLLEQLISLKVIDAASALGGQAVDTAVKAENPAATKMKTEITSRMNDASGPAKHTKNS